MRVVSMFSIFLPENNNKALSQKSNYSQFQIYTIGGFTATALGYLVWFDQWDSF